MSETKEPPRTLVVTPEGFARGWVRNEGDRLIDEKFRVACLYDLHKRPSDDAPYDVISPEWIVWAEQQLLNGDVDAVPHVFGSPMGLVGAMLAQRLEAQLAQAQRE